MKMYSTAEVAEKVGLSVDRIHQAAKSLGVGKKVGSFFVFTERDIEAILARKGERGAPRGPRKKAG